jgi:hypothetical protein
MLGFLLSSSRGGPSPSSQHHPPGPVARNLNPVLLSLSKRACIHPIYTIVAVAVLASSTYLGLLDSSLFDRTVSPNNAVGHIAINNTLIGSKKLYAGPDSDWKWSNNDETIVGPADDVSELLSPCNISIAFVCHYANRYAADRTSLSSHWSFPNPQLAHTLDHLSLEP